MQIHELKTRKSIKPKAKVGRGGKRGKTSGRGMKGQKARAGHKIRPEIKDLIKKIPKLRGYGSNRARTVNSGKIRFQAVNLANLEENFDDGAEVNPKVLLKRGLVSRRSGKTPPVKILGRGELKKKLVVSGCATSGKAFDIITKAGGSVATSK